MFTSFRQRLLFCFMLIISVSIVIVTLTYFHFVARSNIAKSTALIESCYVFVLKDANARQNFFNQDNHNPDFFASGKSDNLKRHYSFKDSVFFTVKKARESFISSPQIRVKLDQFKVHFISNAQLFDSIVELILQRGYKDFSLEGAMRRNAHKLENLGAIPLEDILRLRRHEKDYIIRNERDYVNKLNVLATGLEKKYAGKNDSVAYYLSGYQKLFNNLVLLDNKIGLKNDQGMKRRLDEGTDLLEESLSQTVAEVRLNQDKKFNELNNIYLILCSLLVFGSIVGSLIIAQKITQPLTELTEFITRFINSHFTVEEQPPKIRTKDEIGKLTANFNLLKDEVINHIKYFKQKVDERTMQWQVANKRLKEVNEANSRFVPKEFLNYLNKSSIEEIAPGDQISREMTILFCDIRSFTMISESLSPQDNFDFINMYLEEILPVIRRHHGFIDKFIGDSVMAIFPEPHDAIKTALAFSKALEKFNKRISEKNISPIAIGTGIHTGQLALGTIGNIYRLETTVISDAVNIASRIEGLTKHYAADIIVSEETIKKAGAGSFYHRYLGEVRVKGKLRSLRVYEILNPSSDTGKIASLEKYNEAMNCLKEKKAAEACSILNELSEKDPGDELIKMLSQRCQVFVDKGFPHGWDGIESVQSK